MRIQYCSDLHLELARNSRYILKNPLQIQGDILLLAGDIIPLHDEFFNDPFFEIIAGNYKQVFWVPGNHEFYYKDITEFSKSYNIQIRDNIHIVNNIELIHKDIRFIFSTLWTKIDCRNERNIEQSISDFTNISYKNKKLKSQEYNTLHFLGLEFIQRSLQEQREKTIVVTHHLPSHLCNSSKHKNSSINEAFCVDLTNYITSCNANYWIYGHSHYNQKPLYIGNTILLTNQLGYVQNNEHENFRRNAYISL
jgi:Icc-related predicted phosphoesterase